MFEKVLEIMRLLHAIMSSYFGDIETTIWYKQYEIVIDVYRIPEGKVSLKISIWEDGICQYVFDQLQAGTWNNKTWALTPSKVSKTIENALKAIW